MCPLVFSTHKCSRPVLTPATLAHGRLRWEDQGQGQSQQHVAQLNTLSWSTLVPLLATHPDQAKQKSFFQEALLPERSQALAPLVILDLKEEPRKGCSHWP